MAFRFFFFFQAEDGIRDDLVTGVQTCALPISCSGPGSTSCGDSPTRRWLRGYSSAACRRAGGDKEIGRASCRGKSVDLGGRRIIKKKKDSDAGAGATQELSIDSAGRRGAGE